MSTATQAQLCRYCDEPAVCSVILWGGEFTPVCRAHEGTAREEIRREGGSIVDVKNVEQGPIAYREARVIAMAHPAARLAAAQEPALAFVEPEPPGTYFGLQAGPERVQSAFDEAPARPTPRAPIGRRSAPRGAVLPTRKGKDIMGAKGKHIAKSVRKGRRAEVRGPARRVAVRPGVRQEIPDSLLQMLGTDWKTMRAHRVHDNRMTVNIDGVRYTVYTRRG